MENCIMQNLIIGNTSQLAKCFSDDYIKISSRNIDYSSLKKRWSAVHLCFGENRPSFMSSTQKDHKNLYLEANYNLVLRCITELYDYADKIVAYSTAGLWSDTVGPVDIDTPFKFVENNYTLSKYKMTVELSNKTKYSKVVLCYPFNFNVSMKSNDYLFGKICNSIVNKQKITIGDTYYYRELIHPCMVADECTKKIEDGVDFIVGSGRMIFINDFIRKIYNFFDMEYDEYVEENIIEPSFYRIRPHYYANYNSSMSEDRLFKLIVDEIIKRR